MSVTQKIDKLIEEAEYGLFSGRSKTAANILDKIGMKNTAMGIRENRLNLAREKRALRKTTSGNNLGNIAAYAASAKTPRQLNANNHIGTKPSGNTITMGALQHPRARSLLSSGSSLNTVNSMFRNQGKEFGRIDPMGIRSKINDLRYTKEIADPYAKKALSAIGNSIATVGKYIPTKKY